MSATLRAALLLRATVLKRRYGSPLEALLLAGVCLLAGLGGRASTSRGLAERWVELGAGVLVLGALLGLAGVCRRSLYGVRELPLLLSQGLSWRQLCLVRALEALVLGGVLASPLACAAAARLPDPAAAPALLGGLGLALALAAWGLLLGWLDGAWGRPGRAALVALGAGAAALLLAGALGQARVVTPGGVLLGAVAGDGVALGLLYGAVAAGGLLAALCLPLRHAGGLDRAGVRATGRRRRLWPLLGLATRLLPRDAGSLLRRDLAILLRGGFPRGLLLLALLPAGAALILPVRADATLKPWQLQLAGLLLAGGLSSGAGYLFGVDFPLARSPWRLLERSLPLRARDVLLSRWAPGLLGAALVVALVAWGLDGARHAPPPAEFLPRAGLLALLVSFDAAAFGLRCEALGQTTEAAGYPLRAGTLVVVFAGGLLISPLAALGYPLLGYLGEARRAMRAWEAAELPTVAQEAA